MRSLRYILSAIRSPELLQQHSATVDRWLSPTTMTTSIPSMLLLGTTQHVADDHSRTMAGLCLISKYATDQLSPRRNAEGHHSVSQIVIGVSIDTIEAFAV